MGTEVEYTGTISEFSRLGDDISAAAEAELIVQRAKHPDWRWTWEMEGIFKLGFASGGLYSVNRTAAKMGPLPLGTKIRTTVGGAYTGTMHELSKHVLESGNRVLKAKGPA